MSKITFVIILMIMTFQNSYSQGFINPTLIQGSIEDERKLIEAWGRPYGISIGNALSGGWTSTARVHKFPGGSLSMIINTPIVPVQDKTFDLSQIGFTQYRLYEGQNPITPTSVGDNIKSTGLPIIAYESQISDTDTNKITGIRNAPQSIGSISTITLQAGLSLPKKTNLILRYSPLTLSMNGNKIGHWGAGLKHDLSQWIPTLSSRSIDFSILLGFSSYYEQNKISFKPEPTFFIYPQSVDFSNQNSRYGVKALTTQLIISKEFIFFTPYVSAGLNHIDSRIQFKGTYPKINQIINNGPEYGKISIDPIENPLDIKYKANNSIRGTVGFQLRFIKICYFSMEYTIARYRVFTIGMGLTYR